MFPIGRIYGSGTQEQEVGVSLFTIPLSDQLVEFVLHITTTRNDAGLDVLTPRGRHVLSKDTTRIPFNFQLKLLLSL